jgi:hypothetical protein
MASTHRALPVLLRICALIEQLFIVEVGPFGQQLDPSAHPGDGTAARQSDAGHATAHQEAESSTSSESSRVAPSPCLEAGG